MILGTIVFLCGFAIRMISGQSISVEPPDQDVCAGSNVIIPWAFIDEPNLNVAIWSTTSAAFTGNIMRKIMTAAATSLTTDVSVVHGGNGQITLNSVTTDNNGTYKLVVTYTSATAQDEDEVVINVLGTPTATLKYDGGSCKFDGGTTENLVLKEEVNGTRKYCCVTGAAAACINGSTETKYCIEVQGMFSTAPAMIEGTTIVTALLSGYLGWRLC